MKLLCLLKHDWNYFQDDEGRRCQRCWRWEYKFDGQWYWDKLGSKEKDGKHIKAPFSHH